MRGGEFPPYEPWCPGSVFAGVGPRYQNKKSDEGPVPAVHESTLVNGLAPYPLPAPQPCPCGGATPVCFNQYNWKTNSGGTCGPWPINGDVPPRTFAPAGTIDLSLCKKRGWKSVQARRFWHGHSGFLLGQPTAAIFCPANNTWQPFVPFTPAVDATRYLTLDYSTSVAFYPGTSPDCQTVPWGYQNSLHSHVDPLSGVKTTSGVNGWENNRCSLPFITSVRDLLEMTSIPQWQGFIPIPSFDPNNFTLAATTNGWTLTSKTNSSIVTTASWGGGNYSLVQYDIRTIGCDFMSAPALCMVRSDTLVISNTDILYTLVEGGGAAYGGQSMTWIVHCALSDPNASAAVYADALFLKSLWDLTDDTRYPFRNDSNTGIAPLVTRNEYPGDVWPEWSDTFEVPDPNNTTPTYDENCFTIGHTDPDWIPTYKKIPWVDPNAALYDGSIIGAPLPAGYGYLADGTPQGIFDFRHENYVNCPNCNDAPAPPDVVDYGAWTPSFLPQNCAQWTPDQFAPLFPPGKFALYGAIQDLNGLWTPALGLWVQDWVQTEDTWQSYDFARPAGADRFVFYETIPYGSDAVWQVVSGYSAGTGDTIVLTAQITDLTAGMLIINAGDVWGGQSVGGFYHVTKLSDNSVLLGAKVFDVPSGWSCPSGDMATAFGRLRFPDCPGILGRVAISDITNAAPCQLTIESSPWLATNLTNSPPLTELVDLCAADMTVLASNVAIARVSDTVFTVPNSGATAYAAIAAAKFLVVHGAAAFFWDDNMPKGKLLTLEFGFDYRLWIETRRINALIAACDPACDCSALGAVQTEPFSVYSKFVETQMCLPFTPCSPRIAPLPAFPDSFPLDGQNNVGYGSRWQACVISAVRDLLWQKPHHPPLAYDPVLETYSDNFAWLEDDGSCEEDQVSETGEIIAQYYAHGPLVEAFAYMPFAGQPGIEEAPPLPPGITIGLLSPVDNSGGVAAPMPGGSTPWTLHQNLCGCIGVGRFSATYGAFTVDC